ncbi:hypothetical protein GIB67_043205 [Kingdonia uniflora]|uniref:GYF domain-containing protein n=1 Tax=Kingdonia uniflora TaxID=39325 RepID=A0A7J7NK41_9MAGN|nr:hypothetical protein GIB67_043205 [Kingdonia uniflora]
MVSKEEILLELVQTQFALIGSVIRQLGKEDEPNSKKKREVIGMEKVPIEDDENGIDEPSITLGIHGEESPKPSPKSGSLGQGITLAKSNFEGPNQATGSNQEMKSVVTLVMTSSPRVVTSARVLVPVSASIEEFVAFVTAIHEVVRERLETTYAKQRRSGVGSKLSFRRAGPCHVIRRIRENAYELDLPPEEECEDLRLRMKGQLKKLTVVELEQKSRVLHEDITKHIPNISAMLWPDGAYMQLLKTPAEQQRLLQEVPKVVAEEMEIEVTIFEPPNDENEKHGDDYSPRSIILTSSEVLDESAEKRTQSIVQAITHPAGTGLSTDAIATSQIVMSYLAGEDQNEDVNEIVAKKDEDIEAVILVSGQDELGVQIDILHEASRSTVSNVSGIGHFTKEVATSEVVIFDLAGEDMNGDEVDEKSAKKEGSRVTVSNVSGIGHFTNDVATSEVVIFDLAGEDMNGDVVGEKSAKKEGSRGTVSNVLGIGHFTKEIAASEVAIIDLAGEDMNGDEVDEKSAKKEVSDKNVEKQLIAKGRVSAIEVIDLDDDEEDEEVEDLNARIWHYVDPEGNTQGPFQMSALKKWKDSNYFPDPEFKVWKTGKTQEKSILLTDALHMVYQK